MTRKIRKNYNSTIIFINFTIENVMIDKRLRNIALAVLLVFTFFYCGNVFFMHIHHDGGVSIVHSHPYLPSSHHSHNAGQYASIALANLSLSSAIVEQNFYTQNIGVAISELQYAVYTTAQSAVYHLFSLRAPPSL